MRLSRLNIAGFKSFPDRAELGFDHGVTAIVGPNGCGKSNVVDAITWVLGEQSAKSLRGERMEDVIFNGSDARKPTATAEVRLKLSDVAQAAMAAAESVNGDLTPLDVQPIVTRDVEIGRRLYRSGESEYLIDGEVCRLRDVHDLLMDSGLGIKAYAVIEQGKIGQILSSRPAERRALIEEAAGVTKYKSRRRTAELKLEAAHQNLTRVDDIVFEVEKQRGALRRQASRARRYKRLREELRKWEQVQFARKYATLSRDIENAEHQLEAARAREAAAAAHVAELEASLEAVRLALTEAENGATAARETAHAHELEIGRGQQQIQFDKQQIEELAQRSRDLATEVADLEGRRDPARLAIEAQREAARKAREALDEAGRKVAECEGNYSRALVAVQAAEHDADETRAAVLAATSTLSALRQARDHAAAVRDRVAAERSRLDIEARDLHNEVERAEHDRTTSTAALADARTSRDRIVAARTAAEADLSRQRGEREIIGQELLAAQHELANLDATLRSLEQLDASRATFSDGSRFLLGDDAKQIGRHGAVADFLDVERSYERAVDALLGDVLQYVVVEKASDLEAALTLAADHNAGRCGFIVIEELAHALPSVATSVPDGARTLRSVVRARGPHAAALSRLIDDSLIAADLTEGLRIARQTRSAVATMGGEVVRGAGVVEGGSRRDARGILETRGEVLVLREQVDAQRVEISTLTNRAAEADEAIAAVEAALAGHVTGQHDHEKAIVGFEAQVARAEEECARLGRRLDVVVTEQRRASEEEQTADRRREEAAAAITLQETQQRGAEHKLGDVMARLQSTREEAEVCTRLVTEARSAQAGLIERTSALDTEGVRLDEAARELEERIAGRRAEIDRYTARREELREGIVATGHRVDDEVRALDQVKQQVRDLDERVAELRTGFSQKEQAIRAARHAHDDLRSEVTQSEVARATAVADLSHLGTTCVEAVNLTIEEVVSAVERMEADGELVAPSRRLGAESAVEEEDEGAEGADVSTGDAPGGEAALEAAPAATVAEMPTQEASAVSPEQIIADLRRKLERLGPVNMMAIEQFDELETRHAFLTTQRKDLLDSISQTNEAIKKIDKTTRERFAEAFQVINQHFETTFTTLFGGGRAALVLIDQENDPESGIDIIAQPPGKRLQNVQLLSGGEKALTAMALMFAVFKYRPSPFCLLDEIDAPLDDANVGRFVDMLSGMQDHTQFILITHNRKTMEIADRLYGVTMEEPGVSKLISVQLN